MRTVAPKLDNNQLLRMDDLYHAFKNNSMVLEEVKKPSDIVKAAILKMVNPSVEIGLDVSEEYPILADSHHLSEAIYNLIKNSVDSIEQKAGTDGNVRVRLYIQGQNQIFDPFYSSKNSKKSWGIGLLYVEQIVRGHFGEISVESSVGEGTTFYVAIPWYRKL